MTKKQKSIDRLLLKDKRQTYRNIKMDRQAATPKNIFADILIKR